VGGRPVGERRPVVGKNNFASHKPLPYIGLRLFVQSILRIL
jgi:hypothetical protein